MRLIKLFVLLPMAIAFSSCVEIGSSSVDLSKEDSILLQQKLIIYKSKDTCLVTARNETDRGTGIYGIWINLKLKNYLLKESTVVDSTAMLPLTLIVDQKGAFFTFRYESPIQYHKVITNGSGHFSIGEFKALLKNDSVINVRLQNRSVLFERIDVDKDHMPNLTAALNNKLINYVRLRWLVTIKDQQVDTVALRAVKSNLGNEILCSTFKSNFKYSVTYAFPVIFDKSFTPAVYYLNSTGLEEKRAIYEISLKKNEVQLKDLNTKEVRYKFLY